MQKTKCNKVIRLFISLISVLLICTVILSSCANAVQGDKGEKGDVGAQGEKGDAGDKGDKGDKGENGKTPYIGDNGNWWIGDLDTGVNAAGIKGDKGDTGAQGNKGDKGDTGAQGNKGDDGKTPYIGEDGNWWIGDKNTGVDAFEPNIKIDKYCTVPASKTVNSGDAVIYFITIENLASKDILVYAEDTVPENTVYSNGADFVNGEKLLWSVSVPKGQTVSVHYTVNVASSVSMLNGVKIDSTVATVGKKSASTNSFYVGRTLNSVDSEYVNIAVDALYSSTYSDLELAKWIYEVAYTNGSVISSNLGTSSLNVINSLVDGSASNKIKDMIAPTLYGGTSVSNDIVGVKGSQATEVGENDLVIGDILIKLENGKTTSYIYCEEGLRSLSAERETVDTDVLLSSVTECDAYAVFRPSLALVSFTPSDVNATPDVLTEKQRIIVETAKYYLLRGECCPFPKTSDGLQRNCPICEHPRDISAPSVPFQAYYPIFRGSEST